MKKATEVVIVRLGLRDYMNTCKKEKGDYNQRGCGGQKDYVNTLHLVDFPGVEQFHLIPNAHLVYLVNQLKQRGNVLENTL